MPTAFYKCNKCKRTFDSRQEAAGCEKSHLAAVSVKASEYRIGKYPFSVIVTFKDGVSRVYLFDDGSMYYGKG